MPDSKIQRRIAGRLLENESLTADLVDDAAKVLLDWGLNQAMDIAQQAEAIEQDYLETRLDTLQSTMRRINQQAGTVPPESQPARVRQLLDTVEVERSPSEQASEETHET